jgi:voltage-gated potassium channel Kch
MLQNAKTRPDVLLLLSLLLLILLHPVLDHGELRRVLLGVLTFVPVILSTVKLAQLKGWVWPAFFVMLGAFIFSALSEFYPSRALAGTKWAFLAGFFAMTVIGLFSYVRNARIITTSHLYTTVSIYLLLGFQWFALYSAIDSFYPGAIQHNSATVTDRSSELLYFSLTTLSTIGYGDVVPVYGEVRMLAALEGITGVLYIAITIAIVVSSFRARDQGGRS